MASRGHNLLSVPAALPPPHDAVVADHAVVSLGGVGFSVGRCGLACGCRRAALETCSTERPPAKSPGRHFHSRMFMEKSRGPEKSRRPGAAARAPGYWHWVLEAH